MAESKYILWDFDGTLAQREGMWSGTLMEILETEEPGLSVTLDDIRQHLQTGFPWHTPEKPHCDIGDPTEWWEMLFPVFEKALISNGLSRPRACELAAQVPAQYCRPDKWKLFKDTIPALSEFSEKGWLHIILSNHVPELSDIVNGLGMSNFFSEIFTSALTGYEKPHKEAFWLAMSLIPENSFVWMVGDSPNADIRGAERVGIPGVLVRRKDSNIKHQCEGLMEALEIIESNSQP
jgi:putative hydrolase of the HAD superfamily